jgi:nitrate reductase delta subunit
MISQHNFPIIKLGERTGGYSMGVFASVAEAIKYPCPESKQKLLDLAEEIPDPKARACYLYFLERINQMDVSQWQELYTCTWDLQPAANLYIGYQVWGDSYPRAEFMARLKKEMSSLQIATEGELPDHLIPILCYLDVAPEPVPELLENILPAVRLIQQTLRKADSQNPYLALLDILVEQLEKGEQEKNHLVKS